MIDGKYRIEWRHKNRNIMIDLADMSKFGAPYRYEVMAMRNSIDFDEYRTNDLNDAIQAYNAMVEKYREKPETKPQEKPLTGKYAKLRDDLKAALAYGKAHEGDDDGGTCNLDACAVKLPRWREALVERAAKEAGTHSFVWELWGSKDFVFCPDTNGQGNKRSRNADAMTDYMRQLGYDALEYSQMD